MPIRICCSRIVLFFFHSFSLTSFSLIECYNTNTINIMIGCRLSSTESLSMAQSIFNNIKLHLNAAISHLHTVQHCNCFLFYFFFLLWSLLSDTFAFLLHSFLFIGNQLKFEFLPFLSYYNCVHLRLSRLANFSLFWSKCSPCLLLTLIFYCLHIFFLSLLCFYVRECVCVFVFESYIDSSSLVSFFI